LEHCRFLAVVSAAHCHAWSVLSRVNSSISQVRRRKILEKHTLEKETRERDWSKRLEKEIRERDSRKRFEKHETGDWRNKRHEKDETGDSRNVHLRKSLEKGTGARDSRKRL